MKPGLRHRLALRLGARILARTLRRNGVDASRFQRAARGLARAARG